MLANTLSKVSKHISLLGWFVLISMLVHGLFLAIPEDKAKEPFQKKQYVILSSPLQVTVLSSRPASRPNIFQAVSQSRPVVEKNLANQASSIKTASTLASANNKTAGDQKSTINNLNHDKPVKLKISKRQDIEPVKISGINTTKVNSRNIPLNHLRQQLRESIRTRFTYPRMAQRMGWQGLVGLTLHIEDDGSLKRIRIARTSGHKVLDENARKTIQSIGRLQIATNLSIQPVDTEIEVLYRLTD